MTVKNNLLQKAYAVETPQDVQNLYRDWAKTYDADLLDKDLDYVAPVEAARVFKDHFDTLSASIIDVGCGTGLSGLALKNAGFDNIDGIDISSEMLEQAKAKKIYGNLLQSDLTASLNLPDHQYDAAFSVGTFTHGHVGPDRLVEVLRIIKPGGFACITVNEGVFDTLRYPDKLKNLEQAQVCRILDVVDTEYLRGEGIRSKVICLHVLP